MIQNPEASDSEAGGDSTPAGDDVHAPPVLSRTSSSEHSAGRERQTRGGGDVIVENYDPSPGLSEPVETPVDPNRVRKNLAWAHVYILAGVVLVGAVGLFIGSDLKAWASFSAPVFTLVGVVVAFYFGRSSE